MNTNIADTPISLIAPPEGYDDWLGELKAHIHAAQQRATLSVNRELVLLYWQIGRDILTRQALQGWGAKVIERLAHDLRGAFPVMEGFSVRNLKYMRLLCSNCCTNYHISRCTQWNQKLSKVKKARSTCEASPSRFFATGR